MQECRSTILRWVGARYRGKTALLRSTLLCKSLSVDKVDAEGVQNKSNSRVRSGRSTLLCKSLSVDKVDAEGVQNKSNSRVSLTK